MNFLGARRKIELRRIKKILKQIKKNSEVIFNHKIKENFWEIFKFLFQQTSKFEKILEKL